MAEALPATAILGQPPLYFTPERLIDGELAPTMGPRVAKFIQKFLVHGQGDSESQPVHLTPHQRYILDRIYEYDPKTMRLLHDRVVIGMARGNAKTELAAMIGVAEMTGPVAPLSSPHVVVSAASFDQADNVFRAAKASIENGPLHDYFELQEVELRVIETDAFMERIAARAGTSEGKLPTCVIGDELHEWRNPSQERVYTVQGRALHKRQVPRHLGLSGALQISISTAGDSLDTLLGRLYQHGMDVSRGEKVDPGFLFLWWEGSKADDEDLDDPGQLEKAILAANPAVGHWLNLEQIVSSFRDPTVGRHEGERYNLNRWVTRPSAWIAEESWTARTSTTDTGLPEDGTALVIGFKGSYNRNTTALVGWTRDDYGFLIRAWERDSHDNDWTVPRQEVEEEIQAAMKRWDATLVCDPVGWASEVEGWERQYGERVVRFEVQVTPRMAPAVDRFRAAALDTAGMFRHDGSPAMTRHVKNSNARETPHGTMLETDRKDSPRRIDIALAAVIARQQAMLVPVETRRPILLGSMSWR